MGDFIQEFKTPQVVEQETAGKGTVKRYPETGIDVLVVGAGVRGLTAALECYRKGHNVRIYEREPSISTAGDMFSIGLSGRRWMSHWPEMQKEFRDMSPNPITIVKKHTGEVVVKEAAMGRVDIDNSPKSPDDEPMSMQLRPVFHQMLYRQIMKLGIQVTCGKRAIEFSEDELKAYVLTDDQQRASADVIIASDGIGSKAQQIVNEGKVEAKSSGTGMFRASCPATLAFADPLVVETFGLNEGQKSVAQIWLGPHTHGVVFVQKDVITWAIHYKEEHTSKSSKESWHNSTEPSDVIQAISATPGWQEGMKALIRATPASGIICWPLIWRNPSPMWHSPQARIIQLGDSAHSFLPTSGNGATQAIEDSVTLAACLQRAAACNKDMSIPSIVSLALRAHNKLRFERVSCAQKLGFANAFTLHHTDWEGAKKKPEKAQPKIQQWIWRHNPEVYAEDRWDDVQSWVKEGGPEREINGETSTFKNTNIPPGFQWTPWTIEGFMEEGKHGSVELKGDWS